MSEKNNTLSTVFAVVMVVLAIGFCILTWFCTKSYVTSKESIVSCHLAHVNAISDYADRTLKEYTEVRDSGILCNDELLAIVETMKSEVIENQRNLITQVELYLDKVENSNFSIELWATILTIIFLTFGFYGIFKIEESKKAAETLLINVDQKSKNTIEKINGRAQNLEDTLSNIQSETNSLKSDKESYQELNSEAKILISQINKTLATANDAKDVYSGLSERVQKEFRMEFDTILQRQSEQFNRIVSELLKEVNEVKDKIRN